MTQSVREREITLQEDLRMDAEMLANGHQKNLTKLWHSEVVKEAASHALMAADTIDKLQSDLSKALEAFGDLLDELDYGIIVDRVIPYRDRAREAYNSLKQGEKK